MTCPHGEPAPSCCVECLEGPPAKVAPSCCVECLEGPPAKVAPNLLPSTRERSADYHGRCARQSHHMIEPGDLIRYTELGWCCESCASAPRSTP